jgi:hypothetical protein
MSSLEGRQEERIAKQRWHRLHNTGAKAMRIRRIRRLLAMKRARKNHESMEEPVTVMAVVMVL